MIWIILLLLGSTSRDGLICTTRGTSLASGIPDIRLPPDCTLISSIRASTAALNDISTTLVYSALQERRSKVFFLQQKSRERNFKWNGGNRLPIEINLSLLSCPNMQGKHCWLNFGLVIHHLKKWCHRLQVCLGVPCVSFALKAQLLKCVVNTPFELAVNVYHSSTHLKLTASDSIWQQLRIIKSYSPLIPNKPQQITAFWTSTSMKWSCATTKHFAKLYTRTSWFLSGI